MIVSNSKANVGPSLTHQLCTQQLGGFQNVGATVKQFKNFQREMKCLMNSHDGEMFKSRLDTLAETKGLHFVYEKDSKNALPRIFWTNCDMQRAYALFGDGVSYDPTYGTNKYNMTFTPFTGIDHHKRSITFACALIEHENDESFMWVFDRFKGSYGWERAQLHNHRRRPGIIKAVPAKHRFCMWHIMKKITDKVGSKICRDTDFLTRLNGVVWDDDLEPGEFEEKWLKVMNDFSLEDNTWLNGKFADRHTWIPAYFRNVPMGGLLRTTQRSESANSFFKRFENKYGTLTEFLVHYESATDHQMHLLKLREEENANSIPETQYGSKWETQAVRSYTHAMFYEFQNQVKLSINTCSLVGYTPLHPVTNFEVSLVEDAKKGLKFAVECSRSTNDVRWSKNALKSDVYDWNGNHRENTTIPKTKQIGMSVVWSRDSVNRWNKGRGKRLVSKKNKAIKKAEKAKRLCANCKRKGNHDKRNCPYDFADLPPKNRGELADEEVEEEGDEDEE
ncbi:protein FAR1-RELATED SEQUENCE 5-like [Silene latifolia]|uniref:protein FAR1-RELATED SEQUENCE 5-like n=1 Tax=Silene latifolia TaxID=37657 RepID=UPI003D77B03B